MMVSRVIFDIVYVYVWLRHNSFLFSFIGFLAIWLVVKFVSFLIERKQIRSTTSWTNGGIGTAVEPFREKNNNVKPTCHKIYQERYYLLIFVLLYIYFLLQSSQSNTCSVCCHNDRSVTQETVSFFWIRPKSLRATEWIKNAKIS